MFIMYHVSCIMYHVSCIMYHVSCIRPLKVEIYRSTVSTDGFHTKSIIEQQAKIPTYYLIFAVKFDL